MGGKMKRAKFRWRNLGPIKVKTPLDNVPKQSGVYKLTFHLWGKTYAHIGEAGARGLRARIRDYANNPTEGNKVEHLLHDLLKQAGDAQLSVCCIGVDEQKARRQFEKEEVADRYRSVCEKRGVWGRTGFGPDPLLTRLHRHRL